MEGKLYKWTNYFSFWKERYFVLRGNVLYYYIKKGDRPRGRIHLGVSILNESPEDDTKFEIDTGLALVYLKAEDKISKEEWIRSIKLSKLEPDKDKSKITDNYLSEDLNRNSIINDDKLIRKISNIKYSFDKIKDDTQLLSKYVDDNNVMNEYNVIFYKLG